MASVSYYQTLQVAPNASQAEISAAYRRLARQVHPDLNPSPDAHRQMQAINEAYNMLRHPERRRRYDETLAAQRSAASANGARTSTAQAAAQAPNRPHLNSAWLSYQKRIGDEIVFTIGHADNMSALLIELQRRIPPSGRRYDISRNRWHVGVAHADVLRALFRNYAPVVQQPPPTAPRQRVRQPISPRRWAGGPTSSPAWTDRRSMGMGVGVAVVFVLAIYLLLSGQLLLSNSPTTLVERATEAAVGRTSTHNAGAVETEERAFVFPGDCTLARLETAPAYFREACKTLEHNPQMTMPAPVRPYAVTTTRVASNIRSGPDTRFPVLTTTPPGARVQLVGYTISRGYVWYLTNFGGWIRSDLLTEAPLYLPMIGAEEMS
jgi:curved DNA-binding protein CbpA